MSFADTVPKYEYKVGHGQSFADPFTSDDIKQPLFRPTSSGIDEDIDPSLRALVNINISRI
jgi:hypothetical protein